MIIQLSSTNEIIHNGIDKILISPILKTVLNKAGELSFSIRPDHIGYNHLYAKITFINVLKVDKYGNQKIFWSGQVDKVEKSDAFGTKKITCIGILALLNNIWITAKRPSKKSVAVQDFVSNIIAEHKKSVYMITGKTPITIFAESEKPQVGTVKIYCDLGESNWKVGTLPVHRDGTTSWEYYNIIYQPYFYLICDSPQDVYSIRIRAASHGYHENILEISSAWKESESKDTFLNPSTYDVIEKKWMIHDYTYLDMIPGKLYKMRMTSGLLQIDPDSSTIQSDKKIYYPFETSMGKTFDFLKYLVNHKKGFVSAIQDHISKKIKIEYWEKRHYSDQSVRLKKNLIDYNEKYKFDQLYTGIIPCFTDSNGATYFYENGHGDKSLFHNLYVSNTLSRVFGPIYKVYEMEKDFDESFLDEVVAQELTKAEQEFLSITVKMVDMSPFDGSEEIEVSDIVTISTLDVEIQEVCTEITYYLNEPEKNTYKFGVSSKKLGKFLSEQDPKFYNVVTDDPDRYPDSDTDPKPPSGGTDIEDPDIGGPEEESE